MFEFEIKDEATNIFGGLNFGANNPEKNIFEDAGAGSAIDDFAAQQLRSQAMACALGWIEGGDFSYQALNDAVATVADMDGDGEISDEEDGYFNDLLNEVANAFLALGADSDNIQSFVDNEDDDEGTKLGAFLSEKMQGVDDDDETIISNYAVSDDQVMESVIKVVRNGQVVLKQKRLRRVKLSAAQKAGLKIARRKAFTSAAKLARKKSMKLRKKRGL